MCNLTYEFLVFSPSPTDLRVIFDRMSRHGAQNQRSRGAPAKGMLKQRAGQNRTNVQMFQEQKDGNGPGWRDNHQLSGLQENKELCPTTPLCHKETREEIIKYSRKKETEKTERGTMTQPSTSEVCIAIMRMW